MATRQHIVASYDEELEHLNKTIMQMGGIAESQLDRAIQAILKRDSAMAQEVVEGDHKVDELEHEVATFAVRLLALRQPMAVDLRNIVAALKISSDIERIADYASNVAKRSIVLSQFPEVKLVRTVPRMGRQVQQMFKDILDAHAQRDAEKATRLLINRLLHAPSEAMRGEAASSTGWPAAENVIRRLFGLGGRKTDKNDNDEDKNT